ncbi:MAG: cytochrome C oxidase subunit I [Chitinophagaceae bacterium]|nr:cytochrome C oxidase subunit I [Chitinophagaceae bacterium]
MFVLAGNSHAAKTTSYKVVLPFYAYAAVALLVASFILFFSYTDITSHYFHPHTLALTHTMALGWGTMMILGASHQLVPVLIEGELFSNTLAYLTFLLAAIGIPFLCISFYSFNLGWPAHFGACCIVTAVILYLVNLGISTLKSHHENVHAVFVLTAVCWLLATVIAGLFLLINFEHPFLAKSSIQYLPLHAHLGIIGWFLLMVMGVGSRLIPMFLISKYENPQLLWKVYAFLNGGLILFVVNFIYFRIPFLQYLSILFITISILIFAFYCRTAYKERIRKKVDEQMKISLLSVLMMVLPIICLLLVVTFMLISGTERIDLVIAYGFIIFFGWITAIIFGMTFKTLPFIVWNKVYRQLAGKGKTPNPKDLFNPQVFHWMILVYIAGFAGFTAGIFLKYQLLLQGAAILLLLSSFLYNFNVIKIFFHKPVLR